jgi:hypothetical protein
MATPEDAGATQLRNIVTKTGKSVEDWAAAVAASGMQSHGDIRSWLKDSASLGYGDANALAFAVRSLGETPPAGDPLDAIYAGPRAHLRPIHEALLAAITPWGDFEIAPKKANVSLRRKRQFALIGPKNNSVAELGINLKDEVQHPKLVALKPGGMCQYEATLASPADLDDALLVIVRLAWVAAG